MMRRPLKVTALILALVLGTGCVQNQGTFRVLTNRSVQASKIDLDSGQRQRDVEGRAVSHTVLIFFPIGPGTSPGRALDDALAKGQGDVMTNVTMKRWFWTIIVYSQSGWSVRGDVLDSTRP